MLTTTIPDLEAYPKTILLRDGTEATVRPLNDQDTSRLFNFFRLIPEEERFYLKENVTSADIIRGWTTDINFQSVVPIVALVDGEIIADATLHRSRAPARKHVAELRIVVEPGYREIGLGGRLIREILDIAAGMGLQKATFELVAEEEEPAIMAAGSAGFREVAILKDQVKDMWDNPQDLVIMELSLKDRSLWWF